MVIHPVVSEILGVGVVPSPQMLLSCQKEQMLLTVSVGSLVIAPNSKSSVAPASLSKGFWTLQWNSQCTQVYRPGTLRSRGATQYFLHIMKSSDVHEIILNVL